MCTIRSAGAGAAGVLLLVAVSLVLSATPTAGQLKQNHGFNQQQQSPAEPAPQRYSEKVLLVSDSVTNLAQRIARAISSQKSKTEIFSPVSIAGAMSLLLLGSAGQTQKELLRVMGLEQTGISFKDIHMGFGRLFEDLVSNEASLEPLVHWRRNDKCNRVDEEEDEDDDYHRDNRGPERKKEQSFLLNNTCPLRHNTRVHVPQTVGVCSENTRYTVPVLLASEIVE
uniref:Putative serine protease inhibitor n=1 Tax=Anopheles darlingi TaxID=43151 RepID=A0A2M4D2M4_ANODA